MTKTTIKKTKYDRFSAENINGKWCVVTNPDHIIIATVPQYISWPQGVARALAQALTQSKYVLTDLI